jgi:hypothetical protein
MDFFEGMTWMQDKVQEQRTLMSLIYLDSRFFRFRPRGDDQSGVASGKPGGGGATVSKPKPKP